MVPTEEWRLDTERLGRRVWVYDRVESTNTLATALAADPANDGLVLLAREQTGGRGQHGRSWACPAGSGVLMSVLAFPPAAIRRPVILTAWAAVSVCETIRQIVDLPAKIKWPNDVLVEGKKVCGILIEQSRATVIGVGLNGNQTANDFAALGLPEAASLGQFAGRRLDCDDIARQLIAELDRGYNRLLEGDLTTLEDRWKARLGLLGKDVTVECPAISYQGRLRDLSWQGVELVPPDGSPRTIAPEAIRHIGPA